MAAEQTRRRLLDHPPNTTGHAETQQQHHPGNELILSNHVLVLGVSERLLARPSGGPLVDENP
eukprot:2681618-Alexandrium_andersonii.AAC.1